MSLNQVPQISNKYLQTPHVIILIPINKLSTDAIPKLPFCMEFIDFLTTYKYRKNQETTKYSLGVTSSFAEVEFPMDFKMKISRRVVGLNYMQNAVRDSSFESISIAKNLGTESTRKRK